jgi:hypothetical protein
LKIATIVKPGESLEIEEIERPKPSGELKISLVSMPTRAYRLIGSYLEL